jgi:hypothetical protein
MPEDNTSTSFTLEQLSALIDQKLTSFKQEFSTETSKSINGALSSYKTDVKKLFAKNKVDTTEIEDDVTDEDTGKPRKPSKWERDLLSANERMLEMLTSERKAKAFAEVKSTFVQEATKNGILPTAIDDLFDLQKMRGNITEVDVDGQTKLLWKVDVGNGLTSQLPVDKAFSHFAKTEAAKLYLAPLNNKRGTGKNNTFNQDKTSNSNNQSNLQDNHQKLTAKQIQAGATPKSLALEEVLGGGSVEGFWGNTVG